MDSGMPLEALYSRLNKPAIRNTKIASNEVGLKGNLDLYQNNFKWRNKK